MSVYLFRHGQSVGNASGFFQGSIDSPLTPEGISQARVAGQWLAGRGIRPAVVYTSPLSRASRTAAEIASATGSPEPVSMQQIREYYAGKIEGLTEDELKERYPDFMNRTLDERGDFTRWGGESYDDVQERLTEFTTLVRERHGDEDIVVVSHGGTLYQLVKLWCGYPVPRHYFLRITNCTCFKLKFREAGNHRITQLEWMVPLELMNGKLG